MSTIGLLCEIHLEVICCRVGRVGLTRWQIQQEVPLKARYNGKFWKRWGFQQSSPGRHCKIYLKVIWCVLKGYKIFWSTFPPNSLSSVNTIPIGIWDQVTGLLSWCSLQASVSFRLQSNIFIVVAWLERDHLQLMKRMCVDGNGLNRLFYHCFLVYQLCSGYRNSTLRKRPLWNIATVLNKKIRKTKLPVDRFL